MISQFKSREFLAFLATGGIAALVNFLSRIFYNQWLSFSWSVIIAYITGMITAYSLAKAFVFTDSKQTVRRSVFFFILVNLVSMAQTWGVSVAMAFHILPRLNIVNYANELAHICGVIVPVFTSYLGHKHLTFKK